MSEQAEDGADAPELTPEEQAAAEAKAEEVRQAHLANPDMLKLAMDRASKAVGTGADLGKSPIPRRKITFEVDPDACAPGIFPGPFLLTMQSLSSAEELTALRGVGDDAIAVGLSLAVASLHKLNGTEIGYTQRQWLWEALGSGGRQLCATMFARVGMANAGALGKALASSREH